jgi:putative aldouronate transport system permease protein
MIKNNTINNIIKTDRNIRKVNKNRLKPFDYINYLIIGLFAVLCIFPVIYVVLTSFSSKADFLNASLMVFPHNFNIEAYKLIFFQGRVGGAFFNSLVVTIVGTLYSLVLTSLGAYAFTKKDVPGLKVIFTFIILTMFFGGGLIPFYLTVKDLIGVNNYLCLIIPFGINTFNMIVLRNFFSQVPDSIVESCKLDGASEFRILLQFIVPLSKAGLATVALFYIVAKWDDWYWPSIFLTRNTDLYPLALELRNVLSNAQSEGYGNGGPIDTSLLFAEGQNAAMIVVSIFPIMCIYPFLQKYFVKGVMIGSIKS